MKKLYLISTISYLLVACAGGSDISVPNMLVDIPTLSPLSSDTPMGSKADTIQTVAGSSGELVQLSLTKEGYFGPVQEDSLVYKTADGQFYEFGLFNTPVLPSYSQSDKHVPTQHIMQPTADGGALFACCSDTSIYFPAMKLDKTKFGVWVSPSGKANFFAGGLAADEQYLQGGASSGDPSQKGKANYEVWAVRHRSGQVVSSTYHPQLAGQTSVLVVNFNTAKVGGKILGNTDFGQDIELKEVSISGAKFSGTVQSGDTQGTLNGQFFGKHESSIWSSTLREYAGGEIGGIVSFDSDKSLDAAFGGKRVKQDLTTKDDTLDPLQ